MHAEIAATCYLEMQGNIENPDIMILGDLSGDFGNRYRNRYFYMDNYGWVDGRHIFGSARYTLRYGSSTTLALGLANECFQRGIEWNHLGARSGFSPEDMPSNTAGADFGDYILLYRRRWTQTRLPLASIFAKWLRENGARYLTDPITGYNDLPIKDPRCRGPVINCRQGGSPVQSWLENIMNSVVNYVTSERADDEPQ